MINMSTKKSYWYAGIVIIVHFSIFVLVSLFRHWGFMASINDLGVFDQAIWSVLHDKFLLNSSQLNLPINWLGFHFNPVLFLFIPFYSFAPSVIWLIIAQSFALSIAAWPIFLLASRVCQSEKAGFFWAVVYLMNPFLLNASSWDFQPITLAVPFIAISLLSIEKSNFRLLLLSCLFIVLCKEHFGIMVMGFGILWGLRNRRWKQSILLVSLGAMYSILILGVVMPSLSPTGEHVMIGNNLDQLSRYGWLGDSLSEICKTLLFHPIYVTKTLMLDMGGAKYLFVLLIIFLGFPLAAPEYLLPGLADIMANMLSANPMPRSLFAYHSISLIPVLAVAAVYGSERISRWVKRFSVKELAGFMFITSFILGYYFAPLPLPGAKNVWAPNHFFNLPDPIIQTIRSEVGDKASVSVQANVGAHFSQRKEIYRFPNKVGDVDAIVLRLKSPTKNINNFPDQLKSHRKYSISMLDNHLQMDRTEYIETIESLLSDSDYGVFFWNDPWLVFKRGIADHGSYKQIENKLNQLRKEWEISPSDS
jgi:uncharacterized membrane protein